MDERVTDIRCRPFTCLQSHNFFRFAPPQILFPTPPKKKKGCPDQGCIDLEGYPCKRLSPVFATKSNHLSCRLAPLPPNTHQLTSRLSTRPLPILHNLLSFTSAHKSQQSPLFPPAAIQNFSSISPRLIRHRPVQILPPPSTCLWSPQRHHSYHGFHGREFRF